MTMENVNTVTANIDSSLTTRSNLYITSKEMQGYTLSGNFTNPTYEISQERFCEIAEADSEGRLIILPLKIGSSFYGFKKFINKPWEIYESVVTGFYINQIGLRVKSTKCKDLYTEEISELNDLFLSKEQAEKYLKIHNSINRAIPN